MSTMQLKIFMKRKIRVAKIRIRRFLCLLGFHRWKYTDQEATCRICDICGKTEVLSGSQERRRKMKKEQLLDKAIRVILGYWLIVVDGLGFYILISFFFENLLLALLLSPIFTLGFLIVNILIWEELIKNEAC